MVEVNRQRWNCTFASSVIVKWFVLSCCTLVYSLQVRGCTTHTDLFHNIGDDVQMICPLSGDDVGTPVCRNAESPRQYTNCSLPKNCLRFDNTTNIIMYTVVNITEKDFTNYLCGGTTTGSKINFICCFNLTHVSMKSSTDSSMTSSINPTSTRMEYVRKEEPSTSYSTIQPSNPDLHTHSTDCETKIELKNSKECKDICKSSGKMSIMHDCINKMTRNCMTHLIQIHGSNVTFSVQHTETDRCCNVTCFNSTKRCNVISRCSGGSSSDGMVIMVLYILCGVMLVLIALIVGLCFFLCSEKKTVRTQENSVYSHTLGDVKLTRVTRVESHAKNSSTSSSNQEECERTENCNERNSSNQNNLTSETSGWEDNIAYEACKYATEGDYADVDDKYSLNEEDEIVSSATAKENQKSLLNSNSNLYECVIDKGK